MEKEGLDIAGINALMNKESGVYGVSGVSSDFRDLEAASAEGNERAQIAWDKFIYDVKKYVGSYVAVMGGVDAIVFTAGIGENTIGIRQGVAEGLEFCGVKIDAEKNKNMPRGEETVISTDDSKAKILVIPTNEELMIALDTQELVK